MSWFDFLKGSPVPEWARPKSTAGVEYDEDAEVNEQYPEGMGIRRHTQQNFAEQAARDLGEGPNYPLAEGMPTEDRGRLKFGELRGLAQKQGIHRDKPTTRPTEPGKAQAQYDLDMEEAMENVRNDPHFRTAAVAPISRWVDSVEEEYGQDAYSQADDFSRAGFSDTQDDPVFQGMKDAGYSEEALLDADQRDKELGRAGYGGGLPLQPSWNKELARDQQYLWDEDEVDETREEQQIQAVDWQKAAIREMREEEENARQEEERPFEDPFLQYKSWFREVMKP